MQLHLHYRTQIVGYVAPGIIEYNRDISVTEINSATVSL